MSIETGVSSPMAVHESLEASGSGSKDGKLDYLTVDSYAWPAEDDTRKRKRVTDEERRARHREVQRRFMERKLARLDSLRVQARSLTQAHELLVLCLETRSLLLENEDMRRRLEVTAGSSRTETEEGGAVMSNLPWDQIFAAVCDSSREW